MPTVGPNLPTSATSHASLPAGSTTAWTSPSATVGAGAFGDGNGAGAAGLAVGRISRLLVMTGFGFALPSTARIDGILVEVRRKATVGNLVNDHTVQLISGGTLVGSNLAATATKWTTSYTVIPYGGAVEDWNAGLTYADVNDPSFGVTIAATNSASTTSTAAVDSARITVTYTDVSGGGTSAGTGSVSVASTVRMPTVGSGFTITSLGGTGLERQTIRDNANATTFAGFDIDSSGNAFVQFTEATSATDYRVTTMRSTDPTATTPTWTQYRQDTFAGVTDTQRSAIFPQPFAIASAGDGRWLRRINNEDTGTSPATAVLDYNTNADKSTGSWTAATGTDRTFGSNPAEKTVQVSRIRRRSDGKLIAFGEQWPWAAGTRPASGATRISGSRPFVALANANGTGWVEVLTKLPGPKVVSSGTTPTTGQISNGLGFTLPGDTTAPLWYTNEPDGVELSNGDWLMIWRSGTIPYTDGDTAATARSSQYVQVTLKKTTGADTYFFAGDVKRATFNQQATTIAKPIHPELLRDPATNAILFISRDPEGAWYSLNDGGSWAKLGFTSPTATYVSEYYPRSMVLADGRIMVVAHRGADEAFGASDTAVRFDRFTLSSVSSTGGTGGGTGGGGVQIPTGAFVSPGGSDTTGDGSAVKPWRTIRKAMQSVGPGSTIYMRGGPSATTRLVHGAVDLRDINNSALISVKPYPGEYVDVGPIRFGGTSGSSYIEFKGDKALGTMRLKGPFGTSLDQTVYVHGWYVDGPSHHIYADGFLVEGTDNYNCFWLQPTGGHDFAIRNNVCRNSAYIESVYGTQVNSGGPALNVLTPRGAATYNVWIENNYAEWLEGWDFIQLSGGSTSPTNRHRNIWIRNNETNHVFQGQALFSHSDGTQIIGYSGPLRDGQPNDPGEADYDPALPIDVGVVIDGNSYHHGGRVLVQANGRTPVGVSGSIPADGEHDSIILRNNLMYEPRGAGEGAPSPDIARYDFGIKLHGNCPNFRIMYNTILSYPLTGQSTGGNQGIVIGGHTSDDPVLTDRGSVNGILVGNITDYINTINSGGTVVSFRAGGKGWNTFRGKNTIYTVGTGDIQGTVNYTDAVNYDFSLRPTANPNAINNGGSTWIPKTDFGGATRPRTNPNRGAFQVPLTEVPDSPIVSPSTLWLVSGFVIAPTVGTGVGATTTRPVTATATGFLFPPTVGVPAPEENTTDGFHALVLDPNDEPFVVMRPNPTVNEGVGQVYLRSHKFNAPAWTRLEASSLETEGSVPVTQHTENLTIQLSFDVIEETHEDLRAKLNAIEGKIGKLATQRDRTGKTGEIQWTMPTGQTITWDVIGVDSYEPQFSEQPDMFYAGKAVPVNLTVACRPGGRGEERLVGTWTETTNGMLVASLENIPGHLPALGALRVEVLSVDDARSVTWGIEAEAYDPSRSSPLLFPLSSGYRWTGTTVTAATPSGKAVSSTMTVANSNYAIASPKDPAKADPNDIRLTHAGRYRVFVRASTSNSTSAQICAEWWPSFRDGGINIVSAATDGPSFGAYRNDWVGFSSAGNWELLDLGYIDAADDLGGWASIIRGRSSVGGVTISLDSVYLIPTDYWGRANDASREWDFTDQDARIRYLVVGDEMAQAHPLKYEGDYVRVPPGTSRLVVAASKSDPAKATTGSKVDSPIPDVQVSLYIRPRFLTVPDEYIDPQSTVASLRAGA